MMFLRTTQLFTLSSLLLTPTLFVCGQFGVPNLKKKGGAGTSFEDLQQRAAAETGGAVGGGAGADMAGMEEMMKSLGDLGGLGELMNDPEMQKAMDDAMKEFSKMSPDEIQEKMAEAMSQLSSPEIVDSIIDKKEEVLANLKQTGLVSDEQIQKFQEDPELFEREMKTTFKQMTDLFSNPDAMKDAMENMAKHMEPMMKEYQNMLTSTDDTQIEEARLELLKNPELLKNNPLFNSDEFRDAIHSPEKWLEAVKKGQETLLNDENFKASAGGATGGGGAGIGEL